MKYYKFLTEDNKGEYSNFDYTKYLPNGDKPGKWLPKIEIISLCEIGYHAFKADYLLSWINAQLFEVEFDGETIDSDNKTVAQRMRILRKIETWNDKTARLFACWCAIDVLTIYEKAYPDDNRPRAAIETAERFANGLATKEELSAAWDAAWSAALSAESAGSAGSAAWDAALSAGSAGSAALSAAWDAARSAAWDAAWSAGSAARSAAWDAVDAAWSARSAAWEKYIQHLIEILGLAVLR
jgi:hypothetical protein